MSVCNLFRAMGENERSIFYTFSEYTNDLADAVNKESDIRPSGFICLNIDSSKFDDLTDGLQNYYENLQCRERTESLSDTKGDIYKYKEYLLGGLLEMLKDGTPSGGSTLYGPYLTSSNVYKGSIDIVGSDIKDGMKYHEIICYLEPTSKLNKTINVNDDDKIAVTNTDTYLQGYHGDSSRNTAWTTSGMCTFKKFNPNSYASSDNFTFNAIIVLYRYNDIDDIPLGIYLTKDPVTKVVSSSDIYDQGTSYALRICMRFASTADSSASLPNNVSTSTEDYTAAIVRDLQLIDRMNLTIDRFNEMSVKFNDYFNSTQQLVRAYNEATRNVIAWRELSLS